VIVAVNKQFYLYILASKQNGTLYVGVTSNLVQRIHQHKNNQVDGFSKKHNVKTLVYFEQHETAESAITREKQVKKWNRSWKLKLIEKDNPQWKDLYDLIVL
jgi:putative endonuclease